jgi:formate hydrogenlyase subunit 3/multisubunit Na+/H+ antiporter MnhD subunit
MTGAEALLNGCFGMPYAWIANPLALVALAFLKRRRLVALGCAVAALLASQSTWFIVGTVIWGDEAGVTKNYVASLGVGFYLWSLSFLLLGAAALMPVPKPVDAADD